MDLTAEHRLATYGSLAPGRVNHLELVGLAGRWTTGHVRGRLLAGGWGAALGYPGIVLDPDGETVAVHILESPDLPDHWARLDAFEGNGYRRVTATAVTAHGPVEVSLYELAPGGTPERSPLQRAAQMGEDLG